MNKEQVIHLILLLIMVGLSFTAGFITAKASADEKYDMPDSIQAISRDFSHPDTLIGYRSNGVLHIQFKC